MKKTLRFLQIILHKKCITIGTIFVDILNNSFIDIQIKSTKKANNHRNVLGNKLHIT